MVKTLDWFRHPGHVFRDIETWEGWPLSFAFIGPACHPRLVVSHPPSVAISLPQSESHLWEAANILRGPADAADFKTYVFPLLFFKRVCDVHDEEYRAALEGSGDDEEYARFPQHYRFQVPETCHWQAVRAVATNVGQAL